MIDQADNSQAPSSAGPRVGAGARRGRAAALLTSLARDPAVRATLFAFALTRLIVLALFVLTAKLEVQPPTTPDDQSFHGDLSLRRVAFARIIRSRVDIADSSWYLDIARDGYERRPFSADRTANWAFFPLHPLVIRAASRLTGEAQLTATVLSNLFFFAALLLVYKTAEAFGFPGADARRAVFYLAVFPVSYFFSVPVTESLFLMLTAGSFYAAKRERWLVAGLLGALASATRTTGVLLLPALAILYWETYRTFRPRLNFLPLLLIPSGLLAFMYFLHSVTGNALAFKDVMAAWGRRPGFFLTPLFRYLADPLKLAVPWDFRLINFLGAAMALACGLVLVKWRRWSLAFYALASTVVALSSGMLQSQARYALVVFPAFLVLAVAGRRPRFDQTLRTASLVLLVLMTVLFCYHVDVALS